MSVTLIMWCLFGGGFTVGFLIGVIVACVFLTLAEWYDNRRNND